MDQAFKSKPVKTGDNSHTFFSTEYEEAYHSASGALTESINKFVNPCQIDALAKNGGVRILDIGFGLGYNTLAAVEAARSAVPDCEIEITSLEKSLLSPEEMNILEFPPKFREHYELVKEVVIKGDVKSGGIHLCLLEGDARKKIEETKPLFDAVFLDAFSPKKNPELWTVEFFRQINRLMTETAILATYSAATPVRCGLIKAGMKIGPGPGDAMKKGGTLATREGDIPPLSEKETRRLEISPERTAYYDPDLNFSKEDIFEYRQKLMRSLPQA